ncbi:MAG: hypothetical protein GT601_17470 [Acidaminobacter sp.]|uniref:restriction endonuclease subunit S n=1 Tax=Acidaminobacter sp. TaxID=1872102 RepID=UPI00137E1B63|nr:restriction endonuclease subunit S [Acidaminobacter sp.]MZQ99459.1 hypothetical protein [Acidaminobacter sp.]
MRKKKEHLSAEDALAQALVPESEWPYQVPGNWVWVRGEHIFKPMTSKKPEGEYFSYIDIESIDNLNQQVNNVKKLKVSDAPSRASRELYEGDTLFSLVRPYLMNIAFITEEFAQSIASTGFYVCRPTSILNNRYLFRLMTSNYVVNGLNSYMKGDNSPSIRSSDIQGFYYPIPPVAEQQRIVDRIESLFEKLDQAKGLIQEALDSFEKRKAAILHKAFCGELTKKWREENGVGMESWETLKFSDVAEIKSNLVDPFNYLDMPHIAPDNIQKYTGKLLDYRTIREDNVKSSKHRFYAGQILYSKIRPYLSKAVIVDFDGLCSADMYPVETTENTKYLWYFMLSEEFVVQASSAGSRSVLPKINQKELSQVKVKVPEMDEQIKIVELLECILYEDESALELCNVLDTIEKMKKNILARAFRGELDTDDPAEESILVLLDELVINRQ